MIHRNRTMKKLTLFILLFFLFFSSVVNGQAEQLEEIQGLKDKIASKVAELSDKNERAYAGEALEVGKDSIRIKGADNKNYLIKTDSQLTNIFQIQGAGKKEINFNTLKKGDYIVATGPLNGATVSANYIYVDEQFITSSGKVSEVNSAQSFIRVIGVDKETYTLDIENTTKKMLLNIKSLTLENITLAKIKAGDTVHFYAEKTGEEVEKNRYTTQKILIIPHDYFIKPK